MCILRKLQTLSGQQATCSVGNAFAAHQNHAVLYRKAQSARLPVAGEGSANDFNRGQATLDNPVAGTTWLHFEIGAALGDDGRKGCSRAFQRFDVRPR